MDIPRKCYIVATLPEWDGDIVVISSTWVTGEVNSRGLPLTRLPSVPSHKYNDAAERHVPCCEQDRVYAYKERCRCASFTDAKAVEKQLSSNSEMSSDATVTMGLPRKRKIKRKIYSSEEELPTTSTTIQRPVHVDFVLPPQARNATPDSPHVSQIPRLQSPTAGQPFHNETRPMTQIMRMQEQSRDMLTTMKRQIAHMERLMAKMCVRLGEIERSIHHPDAGSNPQPPSSMLPAYAMDDVIALDAKLANQTYFRQLSDEFLPIPGSDLRTAVRNILCRLISPSMSETIHCRGRDKPYVFKNSRLYAFLLDNIRRRAAFATVLENEVAYEARLWFRLHRERVGRASQMVPLYVGADDNEWNKENDDSEDSGECCA